MSKTHSYEIDRLMGMYKKIEAIFERNFSSGNFTILFEKM